MSATYPRERDTGGKAVALEAWQPVSTLGAHESLDTSSTRRSRSALIIVSAHLLFGTVAFSLLEQWSLRDALYFCIVTLSTVGYGDIVPTHPASKLLTCAYILIGVSMISASLGAVLGRMQAVSEARMRSATEMVSSPRGMPTSPKARTGDPTCACVHSSAHSAHCPPTAEKSRALTDPCRLTTTTTRAS